jgi:hypothetical protein
MHFLFEMRKLGEHVDYNFDPEHGIYRIGEN